MRIPDGLKKAPDSPLMDVNLTPPESQTRRSAGPNHESKQSKVFNPLQGIITLIAAAEYPIYLCHKL
jgi:hypothetical protein